MAMSSWFEQRAPGWPSTAAERAHRAGCRISGEAWRCVLHGMRSTPQQQGRERGENQQRKGGGSPANPGPATETRSKTRREAAPIAIQQCTRPDKPVIMASRTGAATATAARHRERRARAYKSRLTRPSMSASVTAATAG